jgi:hypothetical protein
MPFIVLSNLPSIHNLLSFFFFFLAVLVSELRASHLIARQVLYHSSHSASLCWVFLIWKGTFTNAFLHLGKKIMFFPFSINVLYCICWFYFRSSLHSQDKSHLVMVYNPFNMLWTQFTSILLRTLVSVFIMDTGLWLSLLVVSLALVSGQCWHHRMGQEMIPTLLFFKSLSSNGINSSLNIC